MHVCPSCKGERIRILDKGIKKIFRFLQGNNRYVCRECNATWREQEPNRRLKLKRKRTDTPEGESAA
jgi:transposase-like protein